MLQEEDALVSRLEIVEGVLVLNLPKSGQGLSFLLLHVELVLGIDYRLPLQALHIKVFLLDLLEGVCLIVFELQAPLDELICYTKLPFNRQVA